MGSLRRTVGSQHTPQVHAPWWTWTASLHQAWGVLLVRAPGDLHSAPRSALNLLGDLDFLTYKTELDRLKLQKWSRHLLVLYSLNAFSEAGLVFGAGVTKETEMSTCPQKLLD